MADKIGPLPRNLISSMSNSHTRWPTVISGGITPVSLVCAVHSAVEIVNDGYMYTESDCG
jgi:hypothetical protein